MTIDEAAQYMRVHPETIRRWIKQNGFPAHRPEREFRFFSYEIDDWVRLHKAETDET
jgi:excisionase family DNA binding protein